MDGKRRTATEKQVIYANNIANILGIEKHFSMDDPFYEVSKFIRECEKESKGRIEAKATPRQIDYANAISDTLNLGIAFDFDSPKNEVHDFINLYKEDYQKSIYGIRREEKYGKEFNPAVLRSDETTYNFLINNLWGKHGLYAFIDDKDEVVYIGKSVNLFDRIPSSFNERRKSANMRQIRFFIEDNMSNVDILEIILIAEYSPRLNCESKRKEKPTLFHSGLDIMRDFDILPFQYVNEASNFEEEEI